LFVSLSWSRGVSAFFGGPLADRYGRVVVIDICLAITTALTFLNLAVTGMWTFIAVRTLMGAVAGLMAGAGAALVRDMSPRLSRAMAFGMLTIGPVGANWLANFIAGATLPIFHTWKSQIAIMGVLGVVMYIPIVLRLKDLSTALRHNIYESERQALRAELMKRPPSSFQRAPVKHSASSCVHPEVWLLVAGVNAFLLIYIAIQAFGPLMFTQVFHYSPAEAASINAYFWLLNLVTLMVVGIISDRLQVRKPIAIAGALATAALLAWWIPTFSHPLARPVVAVTAAVLGGFLAIGYVPWAAMFSEALEDISPALQATGWAFFGLFARFTLAVSVPLMLIVVARAGWITGCGCASAAYSSYAALMFVVKGKWLPVPAQAETEVAPAA